MLWQSLSPQFKFTGLHRRVLALVHTTSIRVGGLILFCKASCSLNLKGLVKIVTYVRYKLTFSFLL